MQTDKGRIRWDQCIGDKGTSIQPRSKCKYISACIARIEGKLRLRRGRRHRRALETVEQSYSSSSQQQ